MQHVQYVRLTILVLVVNSDQFQILWIARSYSSRPFLCVVMNINLQPKKWSSKSCYGFYAIVVLADKN